MTKTFQLMMDIRSWNKSWFKGLYVLTECLFYGFLNTQKNIDWIWNMSAFELWASIILIHNEIFAITWYYDIWAHGSVKKVWCCTEVCIKFSDLNSLKAIMKMGSRDGGVQLVLHRVHTASQEGEEGVGKQGYIKPHIYQATGTLTVLNFFKLIH